MSDYNSFNDHPEWHPLAQGGKIQQGVPVLVCELHGHTCFPRHPDQIDLCPWCTQERRRVAFSATKALQDRIERY